MADTVIEVRGLTKEFRQGLNMKRVEAVRGIDFSVREATIFGFLGPNGAGKTTTIKVLTGLIAPTAGEARMFGQTIPNARARARMGFLPENPYIYPYVTPREFVAHCGALSGLRRADARARAADVLARVGIAYAADRSVRGLSKGMIQRTGLAAALVADPELLVLDEPMSGLDPVGRMEVRDLMLEERRRGRTVFFSTHILSDAETLCDEVAILRQGKVVVNGPLGALLRRDEHITEIVLRDVPAPLEAALGADGTVVCERRAESLVLRVPGLGTQAILRTCLAEGATIERVVPLQATVEELFVTKALAPPASA